MRALRSVREGMSPAGSASRRSRKTEHANRQPPVAGSLLGCGASPAAQRDDAAGSGKSFDQPPPTTWPPAVCEQQVGGEMPERAQAVVGSAAGGTWTGARWCCGWRALQGGRRRRLGVVVWRLSWRGCPTLRATTCGSAKVTPRMCRACPSAATRCRARHVTKVRGFGLTGPRHPTSVHLRRRPSACRHPAPTPGAPPGTN
jgi:hypothetical protein